MRVALYLMNGLHVSWGDWQIVQIHLKATAIFWIIIRKHAREDGRRNIKPEEIRNKTDIWLNILCYNLKKARIVKSNKFRKLFERDGMAGRWK